MSMAPAYRLMAGGQAQFKSMIAETTSNKTITSGLDLSIPYHLENFVGGNLIGPLSGKFMDNTNPATGEIFCQIPDSGEKDIEIAVTAAKKAFPQWSVTPAEE